MIKIKATPGSDKTNPIREPPLDDLPLSPSMAHEAVNVEISSEATASDVEGEFNGVDSTAHSFESPHDDIYGRHSQATILADNALPSWFLRNCVKSAAALKTHQIPLIVREREVCISQTVATEELELGCSDSTKDTKPTASDGPKTKKIEIESKIYEVEPVVYETMHLALQQPQLLVKSTSGRVSASVTKASRFNFKSMYLRYPDHQRDRGIGFLTTIVEYFSQEIGADLITLQWDDILDLAEHFGKSKQKTQDLGADKLAQKYFERKSSFPLKRVTESWMVKRWRRFPFHLLLRLSTKMDGHDALGEGFKRNPLVIHIPEIHSYAGARSYTYDSVVPDHRANAITDLLDAIVITRKDDDVLLVTTSNTAGSDYDKYIMPLIRAHASRSATCMVSIWSEAQQGLHRSDDKNGEYYRAKNVREIQRKLRERNAYASALPLLEPYTEWEFLGATESSPYLEYLAKKNLSSVVIEQLVEAINGNIDKAAIKKSIMGIARRQEAIDEWQDVLKPELDNTVLDDKWSAFSPGVQQNIRKIERNPWTYSEELKFLDLLINHKNIQEGWSDIELDPEIRESITQMIDQPLNTGRTAYGVLKKGRIGGALLYGPPGTGKTHLARVLARETQAVMISVSAADIENMYVGETEKAIKGLFSLGRMLAPSIIFIDEADALFRARSSQDTGYERSRTNQFLYEMDGLMKSETPPFVLLATNFPRHLDHAVLRRTPSRIHIGLPSAEGRERIFNICLREEHLHTDVKVQLLANMTSDYTGSDILTMCIQAALACEAAMAIRGPETVRILRADHFEKAFRRCSPTVSRSTLAHIREFAKEFDSAALSKMDAAAIQIQAKSSDKKSNESDATVSENRSNKDVTSNNINRHPQSIINVFTQLDISSQIPEPRIMEVHSDADHPNEFHYRSLPRGRFLRTATIEPGAPGDDMVVALDVISFAAKKLATYEALSYCWGTEVKEPPNSIYIRDGAEELDKNHQTLPSLYIGVNLYQALLALRLSDRPRQMWIDAICINQTDNDEKVVQVAIMDDVYRRARRVTIWLGPETSDSDSGMRYLQALGSQVDIKLLKMHITPRYEEARDLADRYRVLEISSAQTKSVLGLIQREWFERLWIRQEVYLSEDAAVVLYGRVEVPWKDFLSSLVLLHLKPKVGPGMDVSMVNSIEARLVELRGLLESEREPSLHRLRQCFGNAKCKDPRDRIFAVLGLLHPSQKRLKIFPDYMATKAEVYIRVTLSYLRAFGLADILVECHLHADLNFPSWAPDWSKTSKIKNHRMMTFASSLALAQFEIDEIKGVLRLAGVPISTLEKVGPLSDPLDNNANPLAYVKRICEMEDGLFNIRDNVKSNSEEHFLQTVCVNHANLYYPPSNDFPDLGQVKATILELMSLTNLVDDGTLLVPDNHVQRFLSQANSMLDGRRLSQTSLGLPALVPDSASSGDIICVLLGCEAPMLLRPVGTTGNFRVVGQCFMPHIAHGEALLGPLPPHIRFVWAENIASGERWGFLDDRTGQYSRWDPRLDLLPIDLEEGRRYLDQNKDKYMYGSLGVELLRQHGTSWDGTKGVNMQFFDLI